jgi:hypothetical protein
MSSMKFIEFLTKFCDAEKFASYTCYDCNRKAQVVSCGNQADPTVDFIFWCGRCPQRMRFVNNQSHNVTHVFSQKYHTRVFNFVMNFWKKGQNFDEMVTSQVRPSEHSLVSFPVNPSTGKRFFELFDILDDEDDEYSDEDYE